MRMDDVREGGTQFMGEVWIVKKFSLCRICPPSVRSRRGFTLIELLVVVSIIGLLTSVVLASLNSARVKARDARRISDMTQLSRALELYYHANGQYPPSPTGTQVINMAVDLAPYISPIPTDPTKTGSSGYRYIQSNVNGRQSYTMLVGLEKNGTAWCSISTSPGHTSWNGTVIPANYPRCF